MMVYIWSLDFKLKCYPHARLFFYFKENILSPDICLNKCKIHSVWVDWSMPALVTFMQTDVNLKTIFLSRFPLSGGWYSRNIWNGP